MTEMKEINSGVLSGVKITEEEAERVEQLAEKIKELDNGVLDPEEAVLGDMMGAGSSVKEEVAQKMDSDASGSKVAEKGLLTGVSITEEQTEMIDEVAETIEDIEAYENHDKTVAKDISDKGDTLAAIMGVDKG